jgi:hypothetical protein
VCVAPIQAAEAVMTDNTKSKQHCLAADDKKS